MSHCDARVPVDVKNFLSQKIFQLFFSKHVCSTFQDSGIILSGKKFSEFQTNPSPDIAMRFERQKLHLTCNQRRRTLSVRITWKGDGPRVSHCDARVPVEVKNFLSQKIFQLFFSKHVCSTFQDSGIILSGKKFSEFQTNPSPDIAMRFERQKLPLTCNQRRRTLPVRITWKGDWTSGVSSRFSKSNNFS